ncbi:hypothetical protein [Nocardia yamanashiensis]|uniref:hypothetical protein n=1 Tax=Nocardia yamanashiensis TaxID=209247 RepID=UPI0012FDE39F|nr:hypothetical protein [Nocardia yamanashiensis]
MARLRTRLAAQAAEIAAQDAEIAALTRQLDDLLDREAMHALDAGREHLTSAAVIDAYGAGRALHEIVQDATHPHGHRAEETPSHTTRFGSGWVCPLSWHVLVTRLADCSRVRGRRPVRIGENNTSAPFLVRPATRIPVHHTKTLIRRALALAAADLALWVRAVLLVGALSPITQCLAAPTPRPVSRSAVRR